MCVQMLCLKELKTCLARKGLKINTWSRAVLPTDWCNFRTLCRLFFTNPAFQRERRVIPREQWESTLPACPRTATCAQGEEKRARAVLTNTGECSRCVRALWGGSSHSPFLFLLPFGSQHGAQWASPRCFSTMHIDFFLDTFSKS